MEFPPEHYFQTSLQRMEQALYLFEQGKSYSLAIYVGGVSVECMLRAFKGRSNPTFDEKHNLLRLFAASGMLNLDRDLLSRAGWDDRRIQEHCSILRNALNDIHGLWSNKYRFASEERLRSHVKQMTNYRNIKGDYLREMARGFLRSCDKFIQRGVLQWQM